MIGSSYRDRINAARDARRGVSLSTLPAASVPARLAQLAAERNLSFAELSRLLCRSEGYIARFIAGGPPEQLHSKDLATLDSFLGLGRKE